MMMICYPTEADHLHLISMIMNLMMTTECFIDQVNLFFYYYSIIFIFDSSLKEVELQKSMSASLLKGVNQHRYIEQKYTLNNKYRRNIGQNFILSKKYCDISISSNFGTGDRS